MTLFLVTIANLFLLISYIINRLLFGYRIFHIDIWMGCMIVAIIPTFFGMNYYYLNGLELPWGLEKFVDESIVSQIYIEYYLTWSITFILFGMAKPLVYVLPPSFQANNILNIENKRQIKRFTCIISIIAILLILTDIALIGDLPIYYLLSSDLAGAEAAKGAFIHYKMTYGIPVFSYLMKYVPIFCFVWLFWRWKSGYNKILFIIMCFLFVCYSVITFVKSYALVPLIGCLIIFISSRSVIKIKQIIASLLFALLIIILPFYFFSSENRGGVTDLIFERVFLVQIQGAFLIRSLYHEWQLDALLHGFPLAKYFNISTIDPAQEVILKIWGQRALDDGFVNMNSYYVGQAYVMFGPMYILIAPLIITINAVVLTVLYKWIRKILSDEIAYVLLVVTAIYIPFNNQFSNALYLKQVQAYVLLAIVLVIIYSISGNVSLGKNNPFARIKKSERKG